MQVSLQLILAAKPLRDGRTLVFENSIRNTLSDMSTSRGRENYQGQRECRLNGVMQVKSTVLVVHQHESAGCDQDSNPHLPVSQGRAGMQLFHVAALVYARGGLAIVLDSSKDSAGVGGRQRVHTRAPAV